MQMNMKHESGSIMCCVYRISDLLFLNTCYILFFFFNSQGYLIAPNAKIVDLFFSTGISSTLFVDTYLFVVGQGVERNCEVRGKETIIPPPEMDKPLLSPRSSPTRFSEWGLIIGPLCCV